MSRQRALAVLVAILVVAVVLGNLTYTPDLAGVQARFAFDNVWSQVADGCGFNCPNCGAKGSQWLGLGYLVRLEYACGVLPPGANAGSHRTALVFVSLLGTVSGVPKP